MWCLYEGNFLSKEGFLVKEGGRGREMRVFVGNERDVNDATMQRRPPPCTRLNDSYCRIGDGAQLVSASYRVASCVNVVSSPM